MPSLLTSMAQAFKSLMPFGGSRPLFLEVRSSTWFITAAVCTAIFTDVFLYAVIVPVFPFSLRDRIGVPESDVQHWLSVLLAVYGAGLLVGAPISGYLGDKIKYRKWPLLAGLFSVAGATLLLCFARTIPLLILGRLLQGFTASIIWVVGLALLSDTVDNDGIATAMGYVGTAFSLGTLFAPMLGGIVYQQGGYYAVFAMTFAVIAVDIVLRLTLIEKKSAKKWLKQDMEADEMSQPRTSQQLQSQVGEIDTLTASTPSQPDLEKNVIHRQEVALVTEPITKRKLPPVITLWTSRRLLAAFWGVLVLASIITGLDTTLTLFVNRTFGWNSLAAGVLFLAPLLPTMFGPVIGKFVDKYGGRWIGGFGFLFAVPFLCLLRLVDHNSLGQKILLVALLVLMGTGSACGLTVLMAEFSLICDAKEKANPGIFGSGGAYAQSYSILNIAWAAGSIVGAFWSGGIYQAADWATLVWSWALLCSVSALPVILFTGGWIGNSSFTQWIKNRSSSEETVAEV